LGKRWYYLKRTFSSWVGRPIQLPEKDITQLKVLQNAAEAYKKEQNLNHLKTTQFEPTIQIIQNLDRMREHLDTETLKRTIKRTIESRKKEPKAPIAPTMSEQRVVSKPTVQAGGPGSHPSE
jgi:hypothetical protein